jgi:hypothetical protein
MRTLGVRRRSFLGNGDGQRLNAGVTRRPITHRFGLSQVSMGPTSRDVGAVPTASYGCTTQFVT